MKILDLWCGFWNNIYNIYSPENEVIGVDIEKDNVTSCSEKFPNHQFLQIDGEILPFEDEVFDVIQSLDVLEHVDDLDGVLNEATRVLKKWGKFIVEVPYWRSEVRLLKIKPEYWKQVHHVRMFKDGEMEEIFEKLGFKLDVTKRIKFFDNIVLGFFFKDADIVDQRWSLNISKVNKWKFRLKYALLLFAYKIYSEEFDEFFPKSIHFEFIKNK